MISSLDGSGGFATGLWNMLSDGGVWTVPRCGLVYRKNEVERRLELIARMPWFSGMPIPREELQEFQADDHEGIVRLFSSIKVEVVEA
jgi:hypothetical protein